MRTASLERATLETKVRVAINLDGGPAKVSTGLAFFDHMLMQLARHGGLGLEVEATRRPGGGRPPPGGGRGPGAWARR